MNLDAHGTYELTLKGEIFIIRFFEKWNLEGANAFFTEYQSAVKGKNLKRFGVLSDLRQFEGGTPDAIARFNEISNWAKENGQIARAQIIDSGLKTYTINQIDQGKTLFSIQTFSNETDALTWLSNQCLAF